MPPVWLDPSHLHYSILLRVVLWPSSILLPVSSWCVGVYESGEDGSSRVVVGQHPDAPTSLSIWLHLLDTTANPKRDLSRTLWKVCRAATTLRLGCLHHLLPAPCFLFSCLWTALSVTGFVIMGKLVAPKLLDGWAECESDSDWLQFKDVGNLVVDGSGEIDGQGSSWWTTPNQYDRLSRKLMMNKQNCNAPDALHFQGCDNLKLSGLTHLNSARAHIAISGCNNVYVSHLTITAPEDSPNTDGIDISNSHNVFIQHSAIGTGDDCIAINGGCSDLNIANIACGPGHGISVGSLGAHGALEKVQNVYVRDSSFSGTTNGARIKTWQGGSGYARNITFEKITLNAAKNPIIIDQFYCDHDHICKSQASALLVEDVKYIDFEGTSVNEEAIKLDCDQNSGCRNIIMDRIKITSAVPDKKIYASCNNAIGTSIGTIVPNVPCLKSGTEPTTTPPAMPLPTVPLPATPPPSPPVPVMPPPSPPVPVMPVPVMPPPSPPVPVMPPPSPPVPVIPLPSPSVPAAPPLVLILPATPPPAPPLPDTPPPLPATPPPSPLLPTMSFTGEPGVPDMYFTPGASSATKLHKKHYIWCQLLIVYVLTRLLFG